MNGPSWVAFLIAAGIGAPARYLVDNAVQSRTRGDQPRGTLVVNAAGSLLLGVIIGLASHHHLSSSTSVVLGTGFCGAFTTFSTFAFETVRLMQDGARGDALANVALNTVITLAVATLGYAAMLNLA